MKTLFRAGCCIGLMLAALVVGRVQASGSLGAYLRLSDIAYYPEVKLEQIGSRDLHYLGRLGDWHLLMRIVSSVANGMPWSDGEIIKMKAGDLSIQNAWLIKQDERFIHANACPFLEYSAGQWLVTGDERRGKICGTQ
ncbi:hypothetical protein FHR99_000868 [Litorivivens lipolytica]|uniref:Uncharacterized protein n=1 Tax=Litorivivens lipolytica TaxID=1524264 RepID=A0A7W4W4B4_9GAMM|nr:hypothetical protein [Litorivivens lipolytica]MBB3046632.1 hypothetical protein [Litorivivens lipolytica]